MGIQIQVLISARLLEGVEVDGHAVGGHDQRILINRAVGVGAGLHDALVHGVDLGHVGVVKHVAQIHHVAVGAPVGDQALGTFHDQVGRAAGGQGGVDLVVAVGVGQVIHLDGDAGLGGEGVGQGLDGGLIAPLADGIGPQGDLAGPGGSRRGLRGLGVVLLLGGLGVLVVIALLVAVASAGNQSHDHGHGQQQCK